MASISLDPRTGNILIRAYAGINPTTKKDRTISTTLPSHASEDEIAKAVAELDAKAAILKKKASLMTISSIVHYYLEACELTDMSPATLEPYRSYTRRHVDPRIGSVYFDKADASTFSLFYRDLRMEKKYGGAGLAITTVEKIHAMLSGCFTTLKDDGIIDRNPLLGVKVERGTSAEVLPLLPDDFTRLVDYLKGVLSTPVRDDESFERYMFAVLVWVDLNSGIRRGELAGFRLKHWKNISGVWTFRIAEVLVHPKKKDAPRGTLTRKPPKSKKSKRSVSIDNATAKIVNTYIRVMKQILATHGIKVDSDSQLFTHADGKMLTPKEITSRMSDLVSELHLAKDIHLHSLRHTHASYLLEQGASLKDIQERFGHATIETTGNLYGHLLPGRDSNVADMFAGVVESMSDLSMDEVSEMFAPLCPILSRTCVRFADEEWCENLVKGELAKSSFACSVCGGRGVQVDSDPTEFKFCPHCGRRVRPVDQGNKEE